MSLLGKAKGWPGKENSERSDRVTRAAASPSAARVSYNKDHAPLELLENTSPTCTMMYPCDDFLTVAGIKEEFYGLCANAGLTRLALCLWYNTRSSPPALLIVFVITMMLEPSSSNFIMIS